MHGRFDARATMRVRHVLAVLILLALHSCGDVTKNPYAVLGVEQGSTDADIRSAYKRLARLWHPDKSKDPQASQHFIAVTTAYKVFLSNQCCSLRHSCSRTLLSEESLTES